MSHKVIAGVKHIEPIRPGSMSYPFDHVLQHIDSDIKFACGINEFNTFYRKSTEDSDNIPFYLQREVNRFGPVIGMQSGQNVLQMRKEVTHYWFCCLNSIAIPPHFELMETSILTGYEPFENTMSHKADEGADFIKTPRGALICIWPGLMNMIKGDTAKIDVFGFPGCMEVYAIFTVTKPTKHVKMTLLMRFIQQIPWWPK